LAMEVCFSLIRFGIISWTKPIHNLQQFFVPIDRVLQQFTWVLKAEAYMFTGASAACFPIISSQLPWPSGNDHTSVMHCMF
jgi:hypothetical protein